MFYDVTYLAESELDFFLEREVLEDLLAVLGEGVLGAQELDDILLRLKHASVIGSWR